MAQLSTKVARRLDDSKPALLDTVGDRAAAVDKGELSAYYIFEELAARHGFASSSLAARAQLLFDLATRDLSVAFSTWAQLMTLEYLRHGNASAYIQQRISELESGRPGVTGMAAAFKYASGCGDIPLIAEPQPDGAWRVKGRLAWASNLYPNAVIITAAAVPTGIEHEWEGCAHARQGERPQVLIFAVDANAQGVTIGDELSLLGLNSTASSWVDIDIRVRQEQVLSFDFCDFVAAVRPTFLLLQVAECLGVAQAALDGAAPRFVGVNQSLGCEYRTVVESLTRARRHHSELISEVELGASVSKVDLLTLRLEAAELATQASRLETRVAGGAGYARFSPASRRMREAAFLPVQSPSEAQLRWELARAEAAEVSELFSQLLLSSGDHSRGSR